LRIGPFEGPAILMPPALPGDAYYGKPPQNKQPVV
jgi:hypothetical protein